MKHPSKIEDFSPLELDYLEGIIIDGCNRQGVNVKGVYVVGSVCFGLDKINDIDVCVHCTEEFTIEQQAKLKAVFYENTEWKIDVKFRHDWDLVHGRRSDLGFMIPFYDLLGRKLYYKAPYDVIPFNFAYTNKPGSNEVDTTVMVTYDRTKRVEIRRLLLKMLSDNLFKRV